MEKLALLDIDEKYTSQSRLHVKRAEKTVFSFCSFYFKDLTYRVLSVIINLEYKR